MEQYLPILEKAPADTAPRTTVETIEAAFPKLTLANGGKERMREICERFSSSQVAQLTGRIRSLLQNEKASRLYLSYDWAAYSFAFSLTDQNDNRLLNGGLIWHGDEQVGYQPGRSVQVDPQYGWSIHT